MNIKFLDTYSFANENPIEQIKKPNSKRRDMLLLLFSITVSRSFICGKEGDNRIDWMSI